MHAELDPLLKHLPPKTKTALLAAISVCANQLHMGPDWVQRWLSFTVVADALANYAPTGEHVFELKGGAAIEMRLRRLSPRSTAAPAVAAPSAQPRATRDLDATFRGEMDELQHAVEAALSTPHLGFAFRIEVETPNAPFMRRFRVRVAYVEPSLGGGRAPRDLNSVTLEVSRYEGTRYPPEMVPAFSLKPFGIDGPSHLPCLPLPKQIAQKLHAVTEVMDGGQKNERFRDLVDLVLLSVLAPPSSLLRNICEETFALRAKQGWPPAITANPEWIAPMEQRATEMGLPITTADAIVEHVAAYVAAIAAAESM